MPSCKDKVVPRTSIQKDPVGLTAAELRGWSGYVADAGRGTRKSLPRRPPLPLSHSCEATLPASCKAHAQEYTRTIISYDSLTCSGYVHHQKIRKESMFNGINRDQGRSCPNPLGDVITDKPSQPVFLIDNASVQVTGYKYIGLLRFEGEAGSNLGGGK